MWAVPPKGELTVGVDRLRYSARRGSAGRPPNRLSTVQRAKSTGRPEKRWSDDRDDLSSAPVGGRPTCDFGDFGERWARPGPGATAVRGHRVRQPAQRSRVLHRRWLPVAGRPTEERAHTARRADDRLREVPHRRPGPPRASQRSARRPGSRRGPNAGGARGFTPAVASRTSAPPGPGTGSGSATGFGFPLVFPPSTGSLCPPSLDRVTEITHGRTESTDD